MAKHISKELQTLIVDDFTKNLIPAATIAKNTGCSRQTIYNVLHKSGVDIKQSAYINTACHACGAITRKKGCVMRRTNKTFCSGECYFAWLAAGCDTQAAGNVSIRDRNGQRIARAAVSKHFELKPGYVVHHEDRNNTNNQLWNLRVFASNGDHIKYHRGFPVKPIWDGSIQ